MTQKHLLAGDVGATKTNLAVYSSNAGLKKAFEEASLQNREFDDFEALIRHYLKSVDISIDGICLGIAGPVVEQRVQVTNLPWTIDAANLTGVFQTSGTWLLNDLEALAYAAPGLEDQDVEVLSKGQPSEQGTIAVIAPGTGLGEAFLTWEGNQYRAHPSEGGHVDFGPANKLQIELLGFLFGQMDRVSYENICSGIGIPNLYRFLRDKGHAEEPEWLAAALNQVDDPTPLIVNTALDKEKDVLLCDATLELFVSILAAEAGNLALKTLAKGGIYIGGGIPPRVLPLLKKKHFLETLQSKSPHEALISRMPVKVIMNPKAGLMGAGGFGLQRLTS